MQTKQYYQVPSSLIYEGVFCKVIIENSYVNSIGYYAPIIAQKFDTLIYPEVTATFGGTPDEDNNGKIIIFILNIQDGSESSLSGYVAGYFDARQELKTYYSNQKDIIFMDCNPGNPNSDDFYQTLAHELTHMIVFNQKFFVQHEIRSLDTWIDEGLASAAETVYSRTINTQKVNYYNSDPNSTIRMGQNFMIWGQGDILANYATVYHFFQWLRIQSISGNDIFKKIINQPFNDYRAIEAVCNSNLYPGKWNDYLRDWYIANLFNYTGSNPALMKYGYKNQYLSNPLKANLVTLSGFIPLQPGGGFYKKISSDSSVTTINIVSNSSIAYAGLDTVNKTVDLFGDDYTGQVVLCYNYDGNIFNSATNTSYLADIPISRGELSLSAAGGVTEDFTNFPIDACLGIGE